jgi:hypothetical protein
MPLKSVLIGFPGIIGKQLPVVNHNQTGYCLEINESFDGDGLIIL